MKSMSGKPCECCGGPTGDGVEYAIELTCFEPSTESYLEDEMLVVCPRCYGHVCSALGVERPAKDGEQR
jgi:hypothetical protein